MKNNCTAKLIVPANENMQRVVNLFTLAVAAHNNMDMQQCEDIAFAVSEVCYRNIKYGEVSSLELVQTETFDKLSFSISFDKKQYVCEDEIIAIQALCPGIKIYLQDDIVIVGAKK